MALSAYRSGKWSVKRRDVQETRAATGSSKRGRMAVVVSAKVSSKQGQPTLRSRVLLEMLRVSQLVKKLLAFYGTQTCIAVFTRARHSYPVLSRMNPVYILRPYFFKIYVNIILPSRPIPFNCSLPFRLSD
jgi:hypothetical protein